MKITIADIIKNGIWMTFPPLPFCLSLMNLLHAALTPEQFNKGIPDVLANSENIVRIVVFAMPAFFSIGTDIYQNAKTGAGVSGGSSALLPLLRGADSFS